MGYVKQLRESAYEMHLGRSSPLSLPSLFYLYRFISPSKAAIHCHSIHSHRLKPPMAASSLLSHPLPLPRTRRNTAVFCLADHAPNQAPPPRPLPGRRLVLLLTSASVPFAAAAGLSARAQDIPLFGLRKKLRKIEEEAEEIVKEGEKAVEEGIETAEKGISVAGEEIEAAAAAGAGLGFGFGGDLVQAGAVAGAEVVGVLVGVSVVNGILGPES